MPPIKDKASLERYLLKTLANAYSGFPGTITRATSFAELDKRTDIETVSVDWVIAMEDDLDVTITDAEGTWLSQQSVGDFADLLASKLQLPF